MNGLGFSGEDFMRMFREALEKMYEDEPGGDRPGTGVLWLATRPYDEQFQRKRRGPGYTRKVHKRKK